MERHLPHQKKSTSRSSMTSARSITAWLLHSGQCVRAVIPRTPHNRFSRMWSLLDSYADLGTGPQVVCKLKAWYW